MVKRLRATELAHYTYVLLLTSRSEIDDVELGLYAGSDDYLTKPFELAELKARLFAGSRVLQLHEKLRATIEKLDSIARHDSLTELLNRKAILSTLGEELQRARRTHAELAVMMIDVDFFKRVNDAYGHPAGDAVLVEIARRITGCIRTYDAAGRYGGEEFLVCLPGCEVGVALDIAERLRTAIGSDPIGFEGQHLSVSVSIGVAGSLGLADWDEIIKCADQALYAAKGAGRNRVRSYSSAAARPGEGEETTEDITIAASSRQHGRYT